MIFKTFILNIPKTMRAVCDFFSLSLVLFRAAITSLVILFYTKSAFLSFLCANENS